VKGEEEELNSATKGRVKRKILNFEVEWLPREASLISQGTLFISFPFIT